MTSEPIDRTLLEEAAEWRLLSLLFDCPNEHWFSQVEALGREVSDETLRRAARAAKSEASEGIFHSIFGPGGPAPGREVSYRGWVQPGYLLSELECFYDAFSYRPTTSEVPDHVAVETGFIAYLRMKELYAIGDGDQEHARTTHEASERFIEEHLSKYAQTLSKLLAASGLEYLRYAGEALFNRVGPDKDKPRQTFLPVIEEKEESAFECGGQKIRIRSVDG